MNAQSHSKNVRHATWLFLYAFFAFLGFAFVAWGLPGLPRYYTADSTKIQLIAQRRIWVDDQKFEAVAGIYRNLNLENATTLAGLVGFSIYILCLGRATLPLTPRRLSLPIGLLMAFSTLLGAVHLGQYSKDVAPALLIFAFTPRLNWRARTTVVGMAAVSYALLFRDYWLLVAALYVALRCVWSLKRGRRQYAWLCATVLAFWCAAAVYLSAQGSSLRTFRETVNAGRLRGDQASTTVIVDLVPEFGILGDVLNSGINTLLLQFPAPLLLLNSPFHFVAGTCIASIFLMFWFSCFRLAKSEPTADPIFDMIVFVAAFVVVQSIFEPDYGSALRHLTPLVPLMVAVITRAEGLQKVPHSADHLHRGMTPAPKREYVE